MFLCETHRKERFRTSGLNEIKIQWVARVATWLLVSYWFRRRKCLRKRPQPAWTPPPTWRRRDAEVEPWSRAPVVGRTCAAGFLSQWDWGSRVLWCSLPWHFSPSQTRPPLAQRWRPVIRENVSLVAALSTHSEFQVQSVIRKTFQSNNIYIFTLIFPVFYF